MGAAARYRNVPPPSVIANLTILDNTVAFSVPLGRAGDAFVPALYKIPNETATPTIIQMDDEPKHTLKSAIDYLDGKKSNVFLKAFMFSFA